MTKELRGRTGAFQGESADWLTHQWDLLQQQQWFRGFYKRKDAESELRKSPQGDNRRLMSCYLGLTVGRFCPGSFIVRVSESQPGRYAISAIQGGAIQHLLVIPSYAGNDPNAPGGTRYRLGETSRILFNTVRIVFLGCARYHITVPNFVLGSEIMCLLHCPPISQTLQTVR